MQVFLLRWIEALRARQGWRRAMAAFTFGLISALAFSPTNFTPLLWVCFPALIFLLQGAKSDWQAFATGWSFAFGFFVLGLYWIAASMFVDIAHFWWAVPLSVAGLPAVLSLYYGLASLIARRVGLNGVAGAVSFALLWFVTDYARGHLLSGFPWIITGYSWAASLPVLQITSVIGIYGLTLLTLILVCLPACLRENNDRHRAVVYGSLMLLMLMALWGDGRMQRGSATAVPNVRLRLVQPNVEQAHKWLSDERAAHFEHLLELSSAPAEKPVTHVIWPETASTYLMAEDDGHRQELATHVPSGGSIITGGLRRDIDEHGDTHYYNSLLAIDSAARIIGSYDKVHLVPFGEFIPFRKFLPMPVLVGMDFSAGASAKTLRVPGLPPFSPLICYEAIFPHVVTDPQDRPDMLLNVTNDGWYGRTAGPYQHFSSVRVRAIEEGMPLVRAANTGISGVVDAYGRVIVSLGIGQTGFIDSDLPEALPATFFSRYGDRTVWGLFTVALLVCGWLHIRARRS